MNATQSSVVRLADRLNAADGESVPDVAGVMAALGRNARAAARRLSLAGAEGEERGASRHGGGDPRRRGGDPCRQCG